jgi:hypothetical protein
MFISGDNILHKICTFREEFYAAKNYLIPFRACIFLYISLFLCVVPGITGTAILRKKSNCLYRMFRALWIFLLRRNIEHNI